MEITMNNKNLGRALRYYRKANHYTVKQIADKMKKDYGVSLSPKTIYGWENNQNQPSADNLLILCKIYKITNILEALGYEGAPEQAPLILSTEERELVLKYRSHKYFNSAIRKLLDIEE
jgi:transcriptional regulator with XRE-family HTH domain